MISFLCAALMDWILFFATFALLYRVGASGMGPERGMWLGVLFQVAYMLMSMTAGHLLTRRNARPALLASTALTALGGAGCILAGSFPLMVGAMLMTGFAASVFFNSFQSFMRGQALPGKLSLTVALYTLAWSGGSSLGQLSSGILYQMGFVVMAATDLAAGAVVFAMLLAVKARPGEEMSADEHVEQGSARARPVNPAYVWVAWVMILTAMCVQRPVHVLLPAIGGRLGISAAWVGFILFLNLAVQAVAGFGMLWFRDILYRRAPLVTVQLAGALVFLWLWLKPSGAVAAAGLALLGVYFGFAYFCAVYYSSNSGRRAYNIGVNEFLVGLGSIAGLLAGNAWIRLTGHDSGMYLGCAVALAVSTLVQAAIASGKASGSVVPS